MKKSHYIHIGLFVATLGTTTLSGAEWMTGKPAWGLTWDEWMGGFHYSVPFMLFLTFHEFGHYFMAVYHRVKTSLPYYIPFWLGFLTPGIGTFGAVIRMRQPVMSLKKFFDIGIAGPLAGFVIAVGVLYWGFTHIPGREYLYAIHPEYAQWGDDYATHAYAKNEASPNIYFQLGHTLLFDGMKKMWATEQELPHANEMIHYPYIFVGYLTLFFTALNLLPIGQLDGGHILYGLVGYRIHKYISFVFFMGLTTYAGIGLISPYGLDGWSLLNLVAYGYFLYICFHSVAPHWKNRLMYVMVVITIQMVVVMVYPNMKGYEGWLLFSLMIGRFVGVYHPKAYDERPLDWRRKLWGIVAVVIFILCFSPQPFLVIIE